MIGGMSGVESDVIPYGLVMGQRANLAGLNLVGMKRHNIEREEIHALRNFFKKIFSDQEQENFIDRVEKFSKEFPQKTVFDIVNFVKSHSARSYCKPKI
jgi:UDP-N-acetylglucosamine acyltransferase